MCCEILFPLALLLKVCWNDGAALPQPFVVGHQLGSRSFCQNSIIPFTQSKEVVSHCKE